MSIPACDDTTTKNTHTKPEPRVNTVHTTIRSLHLVTHTRSSQKRACQAHHVQTCFFSGTVGLVPSLEHFAAPLALASLFAAADVFASATAPAALWVLVARCSPLALDSALMAMSAISRAPCFEYHVSCGVAVGPQYSCDARACQWSTWHTQVGPTARRTAVALRGGGAGLLVLVPAARGRPRQSPQRARRPPKSHPSQYLRARPGVMGQRAPPPAWCASYTTLDTAYIQTMGPPTSPRTLA